MAEFIQAIQQGPGEPVAVVLVELTLVLVLLVLQIQVEAAVAHLVLRMQAVTAAPVSLSLNTINKEFYGS